MPRNLMILASSLIIGVLLMFLNHGAFAAGWNTQVQPALRSQGSTITGSPGAAVGGGQSLTDLLSRRTYTPKPAPFDGGVILKDLLKDPYVPKPGTAVSLARDLPWAAVAKGVAKSLPLISTAIAIKELMDEVRCREAFGGGGECDGGQGTQTVTTYCNSTQIYGAVPNTLCSGSLQGLAAAISGVFSGQGGIYCASGYVSGSEVYVRWYFNSNCSGQTSSGPFAYTAGSGQQCPAITVNGVVLTPSPGPDGQCATNVFQPSTEAQIADKVEQYGSKTKAVPAVQAMDQAGIPVEHPQPIFEVPSSPVQGDRSITEHPDGSVTVRDVEWPMQTTADGYKWQERIREQTYPPGATIPPQGGVTGGTTTTGSPSAVNVETCGLPGKPPCKIDEAGTPTGAPVTAAGEAALTGAKESITGAMTEESSLPWVWGFELPTGACSNLTVPALVDGAPPREFDLCGHPATALWRQLYAWIISVAAAFYAWHRYTDAVGSR